MRIERINLITVFNKKKIEQGTNNSQTTMNFVTNPMQFTFEARVDKGLTRFYEANAERMPKTVKRYIESIFKTYKTKKDEIDGIIKQYAIGWDIDRLFKIDKDILRIAIIELVYVKDAPVKVVIDEALELAKKYSTDDSPSFINGILAKVVEAYV